MPRIVYQFVAEGENAVASAFKGTSRAAQESAVAAARSERAHVQGARARSRELQEEAAIAKKLVAIRSAEAAHTIASSKRAGTEFDRKLKMQERASAAYEKNLRREVAGFEREERRKSSILERQAAQRGRTEARANETIRRERARTLSFIGGAALAGVGVVGGVAAGIVGSAARESMQLQTLANRISIAGRGPGEQAVDSTMLRKEFERTALATPGISAQQVGEAVQAFVSLTGDLKTARTGASVFATAGSAFGADPKALAEAAAALSEKFNITGLEELQNAIAVLGFQGKQGAFEIKDMAAQFQRLATSADAFDIGKGTAAVATLGGLTQIARKGTGNARMATTAVENIFAGLTSHRGELEAQGVKFTNAKGEKLNIRDILLQTIATTGGNDPAAKEAGLLHIFGKQGIRGVNPLYAAFSHASQAAKGTDAEKTAAGLEAMNQMFQKNIDTAGSWTDVMKDAEQAQRDSSAQLTLAWQTLTAAVGVELTPKLAELATMLAKVATETNAVDMLVTVFVAVAEAAQLVVKAFQELGLLKKKEKTPAEQLEAKQKEIDKFDKELEKKGLAATPEDIAKRNRLLSEKGAIQEIISPTPDEGALSNKSKVFRDLSHEQFVAEYQKVGGEKVGGVSGAVLATVGEHIARELEANPNRMGQFVNDASSPEQKKAIEDYAGGITAKQLLDIKPANEGLAAVGAASQQLATMLQNLGLPTAGTL